jgi:3-phosphoshikimate 1-carboxyvinyltransferase
MGMIGASAALALRSQFDRISIVEPDDGHAEYALGTGQADRRVDEVPANTTAVLLACPSDRIAGWVAVLEDYPATIMDTGSVKGALVREVRAKAQRLPSNWVPCHPIAGLERSGPMVADAELFSGRKLILTPEAETASDHIERARAWWQSAGALVEEMDAEDHDQVYARTSHLPHLLAFAYLLGIAESDLGHTGGGFRDFSRIGGSDPVMWSGVFARNAPALMAALDEFEGHLGEFRQAIEAGDMKRCRSLIAAARARRSGEDSQ